MAIAMNQDYKQIVIEEIGNLTAEGDVILSTRYILHGGDLVDSSKYKAWRVKITEFLKTFLDEGSAYLTQIPQDSWSYFSSAKFCIELLVSLRQQIEKGIIVVSDGKEDGTDISPLNLIFDRFHKVARQIRTRHDNRNTLTINDEYDVQDLLHGLLTIFFNDIRCEEWTPSYAGGCLRMDFLLKLEQVVIEVKKARISMTPKDLGEQLIIDIEKYKTHPDCKKMICFVYDPEGILGNPHGIMDDLNKRHAGFANVIIRPL